MEPTFIVVAMVMVLLLGLVLMILRSLTISAGIRIRADMVRLLEAYDRIIETKSREVQRLQKELEKAELKPAPASAASAGAEAAETLSTSSAPVLPNTAEYRHMAFGGSYGAVRDHFYLTEQGRRTLLEQVRREESGTPRGAAARALRASLSYETVYRLTMLDPEEQLRVLDTSLNDQDWTLLRDFCEERGDRAFSVAQFCDWLEERAALEGGEVRLRDSGGLRPDGRPRICEGVQILAGGRLYDYSINEREIS